MMQSVVLDEITQKAEWRGRLFRALLRREHDDETLLAMLEAGLDQAHSDGLQDAADVCQGVADAKSDSKRVASVLANAIRELDRRNRNP